MNPDASDTSATTVAGYQKTALDRILWAGGVVEQADLLLSKQSERSLLLGVLNRAAFFADLSFLNQPWDVIAERQTALKKAILGWVDNNDGGCKPATPPA